jgi:glycosyltransferase involved in cell wall biosynthesis
LRVLHAFNRHRSGGGATKATIALAALSRAHGIDVEVFERSSLNLPTNPLGHLMAGVSAFLPGQSVRDFKAMLGHFKPDLVHAHELFPLVSPWILPVCRENGIPVVMTCNDYHLTCPARNHVRNGAVCTECVDHGVSRSVIHNCRGRRIESVTMAAYCGMVEQLGLYLKNVTHFIAPSEFTREWLIRHAHIDSARITAISTLVDIPDSAADPSIGRYAAFAGRFVPEKGIDVLLAASQLSAVPVQLSRNANSFVTVDLPPTAKVSIDNTPEAVQAFYRGARMVVVPSVWFETFGLVAAEAMALGIPVIASRIGALAELIEHGFDGLLFEPGNAYDLAEKMKLLWEKPEIGREMGARAREKATLRWRSEAHIERTLSVYSTAIASNAQADYRQ